MPKKENKNVRVGFREKEFQQLLRKGIGSRTQAEFAKQAGFAPATISRMLTETGISCPRVSTLEKFADNMVNVSLSELMQVCGYQIPEIEGIIKRLESDIDDFFEFKKEGLDIYENIEELKSKLLMFLERENLKLQVKDSNYTENDRKRGFLQVWPAVAEESRVLELSWEFDHYVCRTSFSIYYIESARGKLVLIGSDIRHNLHDSDAYIQNTLVKEKEEYAQESRLLRALIGYENDRRLPNTYAGYGFYMDGVPEGFAEFLNKHADTFCNSKENMKLYKRILSGEDAEKVFSEYWDNNELSTGVGAAISDIMSQETGKEYLYYEPDDKLPEEEQNSCIMERAEYDMIDRMNKVQIEYLYQCARELKIQKFGVVYYHTTIQEESDQLYDLDSFYLC